jgi:hypothetical protein
VGGQAFQETPALFAVFPNLLARRPEGGGSKRLEVNLLGFGRTKNPDWQDHHIQALELKPLL